jgi:2,4-dienoyl-CoA reductase-like NADH-dependent reductase (Old Yellow Enzyme family)
MDRLLFTPFSLRSVEFKNRIFVSPMCQYSAVDGLPNDWHFVHLGSRAVGGAGLILVEATAVSPEGRISPNDLGLWDDTQIPGLAKLATFMSAQGTVPGIQLGHAGRKAGTAAPWKGHQPLGPQDGGWDTVAPSPLPFAPNYRMPHALTAPEIDQIVQRFAQAAERAQRAGFRVVEIHMAHGYLLHQFLSPLSNQRQDGLGGDLEGRMQVPLRVAQAVRQAWPEALPVFVRISATDWLEGGWDLAQSLVLAKRLRQMGIDLIDCSSGGLAPNAKIPTGAGYQVSFSSVIRQEAGIATGAVGLITDAHQAEQTLVVGEADAIFLGRALLRDPYWPLRAAKELGVDTPWPVQYERAKP